MNIIALLLSILSVCSLLYELYESKDRKHKIALFVTGFCTISLAIVTLISQNDADNANTDLLKVQAERHLELLGGSNLPVVEIEAFTRQETPVNTNPIYYNTKKVEYFADISMFLKNDSKKHFLKDVHAIVTYPNDYIRWKLEPHKGIVTYSQYQEYYQPELSKDIDLGVIPPEVKKPIMKIQLPTTNKEFRIILDVIWTNGYYRATFILKKGDPQKITKGIIPPTDYYLTLAKDPEFTTTDSVKNAKRVKQHLWQFTSGFREMDSIETKVKLHK